MSTYDIKQKRAELEAINAKVDKAEGFEKLSLVFKGFGAAMDLMALKKEEERKEKQKANFPSGAVSLKTFRAPEVIEGPRGEQYQLPRGYGESLKEIDPDAFENEAGWYTRAPISVPFPGDLNGAKK